MLKIECLRQTFRSAHDFNTMLLHRYFNSHAFETLQSAKLKTSTIGSFNDSFEFLYYPVGKEMDPIEVKKFLPRLLKHPAFRRGLKDSAENQSIPLSIEEMEALLTSHPKEFTELAVKIWPSIVENEQLSIERRRQIIDQDLRAICFSDSGKVTRPEEILLWSHYAKRHEGIRIGFEFPSGIAESFQIDQIKYQEKRVGVIFSIGDEDETFKALINSALVKCKIWEYEKEYRLFTKKNFCAPVKISCGDSKDVLEHFFGFKREWVKSVDFGVFCPEVEIQKMIQLLKIDYPNVVVSKAMFHPTEYELVFSRIC